MFKIINLLLCLTMVAAGAAPNVIFTSDAVNVTEIHSTFHIINGNVTGYFYSTQSNHENGAACYMGMMPRAGQYNQHLTYSVFGAGAFPNSPTCRVGADTGPGAECTRDTPWFFGRNYTYVNKRISHDPVSGNNTWEGTFIDDAAGTKFVVGSYVTPASFGLLKGTSLTFAENYANYTLPAGYSCFPEASFFVYAPVYYQEDGKVVQGHFDYWGGATYKQMEENLVYFPDMWGTVLGDTAVRFETGKCTPQSPPAT